MEGINCGNENSWEQDKAMPLATFVGGGCPLTLEQNVEGS